LARKLGRNAVHQQLCNCNYKFKGIGRQKWILAIKPDSIGETTNWQLQKGLPTFGSTWVAPGLHSAGVQEQVVGHYSGSQDADAGIQDVVVSDDFPLENETSSNISPIRVRYRQFVPKASCDQLQEPTCFRSPSSCSDLHKNQESKSSYESQAR
jgi:hypothetical protein